MSWEGSVIKSYPMREERPLKSGGQVLNEVKTRSILQTNEQASFLESRPKVARRISSVLTDYKNSMSQVGAY